MDNTPPYIEPRLVEWLRENFPKREYTPTDEMAHIMFEEGKQNMISVLERILEDQTNGE